jgi:hypothetical protein
MASKNRLFLALALAGGLLLSSGSPAQAQVFVGAHGTLMDIAGATWGVGGRVGAVLRESRDFTLAFEAVGTFLFPPCDDLECDVVTFQGNLIFRRQVSSYSEAYGGFGVIWEDVTLENDQQTFHGNDLGFSFIVGTQAGPPGGIRPFLEVRYSIMDELENQGGAVFGLRVPIG